MSEANVIMLKVAGMILIVAGCGGLGLSLSRDLHKRIEELQELLRLMILLKGEIRYLHQPLPDALLHIGLSAKSSLGEFFIKTAQDLQHRNGQSAKEIWRQNQKNHLRDLHWNKKDLQEFDAFGSMLGQLDVEMQLNTLDYYTEQLRGSIGQATEICKSRSRLYRYLGVLGGLAVVLLIL